MKKYILGFVVGSIVTLGVSTFADEITTFVANKATFDVVVNGEKLASDKPVVAIEGNTYLPLKDIGKALDVPVTWNNDLKRVEVGITVSTTQPTEKPKGGNQMLVVGEYYFKSDLFSTHDSKYNLRDIGGEYYIPINVIGVKSDTLGMYIQLPDKDPLYITKNNNVMSVAYRDLNKDPLTYVRLSALGLKARIDGDTIWLEWIE